MAQPKTRLWRQRLRCLAIVFIFHFFICGAPKVVAVVPHGIPDAASRWVALAIPVGLSVYAVYAACPETFFVLVVYFIAHTGMNFYMKYVLSQFKVDEELKGMPMAFLLTSIQQFVAFLAFAVFLLFGHIAGGDYAVKRLRTWEERGTLVFFSLAFAGNIGLNNFSLSLLPMSVNLILRSCLPLATALVETAVQGRLSQRIAPAQWILLLLGVICTAVASYCKTPSAAQEAEAAVFSLGLCAAIGSLFFGALNMVLAGVLGDLELNPVDSTGYMALPAGFTLLLPAITTTHPVSPWAPRFPQLTDWQILQEILKRNPGALQPVFFSGILAFAYNALQYALVHRLSATHASFAGNFNMAVSILFSLLIGWEVLPEGRSTMFLLAILGNLAAFTGFTAKQ